MAQKSKEDLFELIQSLSKGEKKTFKLFAGYHSPGEKNYLRLFEMIEKQKLIDESTIKKKLASEKIITPLPKLKHYLFDLIFKSLRLHHSATSVDGKLRDLFADIEICDKKGLKKMKKKLIEQVRCLAQQHEKNEVVLLAYEKEWIYEVDMNKLSNILNQKKYFIEKTILNEQYRELFIKVFELDQKGEIRNNDLKKEWTKIIEDPILNLSKPPQNNEQAYFYFFIWMIYYNKIGDHKKALQIQEMSVAKMESNPLLLKEKFKRYVNDLTNLIFTNILMNDFEGAYKTFNKLTTIQQWELLNADESFLYNRISMGYSYLITEKFQPNYPNEYEIVRKQAEVFLEKHELSSYHKSSLLFTLQRSYLIDGNYTKALYWNNLFLNEPIDSYREDLHAIGRIINLIIHYELDHIELLPYIIRSTYRFLKKRNLLYKTEVAILNFTRNKIPKANNKKELIDFFKELKIEFQEITKDQFEKKVLEYFDIISWLESKISGKAFAEVIKAQ